MCQEVRACGSVTEASHPGAKRLGSPPTRFDDSRLLVGEGTYVGFSTSRLPPESSAAADNRTKSGIW